MGANDDATVTIDTGEWVYTDRDGITQHTVTDAQTFIFELLAAATESNYRMTNSATVDTTVTCTDGTKLTISKDPAFTFFNPIDDGAPVDYRTGAIRIRESSGYESDFDISTIQIDNVTEPTVVTSATFTAKDNPMRTFTWTTVTVAQ